jgi:hypothetical protein
MYGLRWWQKKGLLSGLVVAEFFPPSILVSYSEDHQPPPEARIPVANPVQVWRKVLHFRHNFFSKFFEIRTFNVWSKLVWY